MIREDIHKGKPEPITARVLPFKLFKMNKGTASLLFSSLLTTTAWLAENWVALASLFFTGVLAIFGCIHYYKSWRLKDVERLLKLRELNGDNVFSEYKPQENGKPEQDPKQEES